MPPQALMLPNISCCATDPSTVIASKKLVIFLMVAPQSTIFIPSCLSRLRSKVGTWRSLIAARTEHFFGGTIAPAAGMTSRIGFFRCESRPESREESTSSIIWICSYGCLWNSPMGLLRLQIPEFCMSAAVGGCNVNAGRCRLKLVLLMVTNPSSVLRAYGPFSTLRSKANRVFRTNVLPLFFFKFPTVRLNLNRSASA